MTPEPWALFDPSPPVPSVFRVRYCNYQFSFASTFQLQVTLLSPTCIYITSNRITCRTVLELQLNLNRKFHISSGNALLIYIPNFWNRYPAKAAHYCAGKKSKKPPKNRCLFWCAEMKSQPRICCELGFAVLAWKFVITCFLFVS